MNKGSLQASPNDGLLQTPDRLQLYEHKSVGPLTTSYSLNAHCLERWPHEGFSGSRRSAPPFFSDLDLRWRTARYLQGNRRDGG